MAANEYEWKKQKSGKPRLWIYGRHTLKYDVLHLIIAFCTLQTF